MSDYVYACLTTDDHSLEAGYGIAGPITRHSPYGSQVQRRHEAVHSDLYVILRNVVEGGRDHSVEAGRPEHQSLRII